MKKTSVFALAFTLIFALACKKEKKESDTTPETQVENPKTKTVVDPSINNEKTVWVVLDSKSGSSVTGNAIFEQEGSIVTMIATLSGLSEGTHALHLHQKADCSSDDGKSSGGHWNPTAQPHGEWGAAEGFHLGDIGNFEADASGNGTVSFETNKWCLGCGDESKDILGKAIIVHEGTDDYTSQPSGAAGTRVSCGGVIE
jgi:superoxide dismutase, Cu-Zn family